MRLSSLSFVVVIHGFITILGLFCTCHETKLFCGNSVSNSASSCPDSVSETATGSVTLKLAPQIQIRVFPQTMTQNLSHNIESMINLFSGFSAAQFIKSTMEHIYFCSCFKFVHFVFVNYHSDLFWFALGVQYSRQPNGSSKEFVFWPMKEYHIFPHVKIGKLQ